MWKKLGACLDLEGRKLRQKIDIKKSKSVYGKKITKVSTLVESMKRKKNMKKSYMVSPINAVGDVNSV